MSETYVLVHGAWHTGAEMEPTAALLRAAGHVVHCPTLTGNRPGDDRSTLGLEDAIASLVAFVEEHDLHEIRLVGHSYGGMVISGAAQRLSPRLRRLVYVNAVEIEATQPIIGIGPVQPHPSLVVGKLDPQFAIAARHAHHHVRYR